MDRIIIKNIKIVAKLIYENVEKDKYCVKYWDEYLNDLYKDRINRVIDLIFNKNQFVLISNNFQNGKYIISVGILKSEVLNMSKDERLMYIDNLLSRRIKHDMNVIYTLQVDNDKNISLEIEI